MIKKTVADQLAESIYRSTGFETMLGSMVDKVELLNDNKNYKQLINDLFSCNDESNLRALLFEVVFAWHFERLDKHLKYEVKQNPSYGSSVDFFYNYNDDIHLYFELKLLLQKNEISELNKKQLEDSCFYGNLLTGSDEQKEIIRLQNSLLSKVQDQNGQPIKFLDINSSDYNIIVVDLSQIIDRAVDRYDCRLTCYGDKDVPDQCQRDIVGLFQIPIDDDLHSINDITCKFTHFRETIHGVLFMRKTQPDPLNFKLQYYFVPNDFNKNEEENNLVQAFLKDVFPAWAD